MAKQHVKVPIRYGRQSQSWGQSFTMILDAEVSPGQAVLIPCNATICSIEELIEEVKWLWSAEANQDISDEFHKKWGCVGALFGPTAIYEKFDKKWCKHFQAASPAQFQR